MNWWCPVYGFGLSEVFTRHPVAYTALKWGGTAYVVYLAWCFFRSAAATERQDLRPLGFIDGFVSLSLNPEGYSMILVMFSQFLAPGLPLAAQVLQIAVVFVVVGLACHFVWIYGGQLIFSRAQNPRAVRLQGLAFRVCMLVVAGVMAMS
ncbi:LysE family translocator [Acidovorax sp.]|uniref:LysE family translocator n=1 Tax=Acidovorax sp. TaxID=1872122 RepID=UPI00391FA5E9